MGIKDRGHRSGLYGARHRTQKKAPAPPPPRQNPTSALFITFKKLTKFQSLLWIPTHKKAVYNPDTRVSKLLITADSSQYMGQSDLFTANFEPDQLRFN